MIELIEEEATKAREIFEKHASEISSSFLGSFPRGACGNASDMLGTWLQTKGVEGLESVGGTRGSGSHGWLEWQGWIIDITSDQFDDGPGPVFIGQQSEFHSSFHVSQRLDVGLSSVLVGPYNSFSKLMHSPTR